MREIERRIARIELKGVPDSRRNARQQKEASECTGMIQAKCADIDRELEEHGREAVIGRLLADGPALDRLIVLTRLSHYPRAVRVLGAILNNEAAVLGKWQAHSTQLLRGLLGEPVEPAEELTFEVPEFRGVTDPHAALRVFDAIRAKLRPL